MRDLFAAKQALVGNAAWWMCPLAQELQIARRRAACSRRAHLLAVIAPQSTEIGSADSKRFLEYRLEDRWKIAGRAFNDLQYLCRRTLLFERVARRSGQERRVLYSNCRLRGKILQ